MATHDNDNRQPIATARIRTALIPLTSDRWAASALGARGAARRRPQPTIGRHQSRAEVGGRLHVAKNKIGAAGTPFRDLVRQQLDDPHPLLTRKGIGREFRLGGFFPDLGLQSLGDLHDRSPVSWSQRLPALLVHE